MTRALFSDGWDFRRGADDTASAVRLPHDAMISEPRDPDAGTDGHGGFFPGGAYTYAKTWSVPADAAGADYRLVFEGVYGDTRVLVDGVERARCDNGYREFTVPLADLDPGRVVEIRVEVDNSAVPNSRWYTGSGIYRPVWLERLERLRIADDGLAIVTTSLGSDGSALVEVAVRVVGAPATGATATVTFAQDDEHVAEAHADIPETGECQLSVRIPDAKLWSAEHPHLYDVSVTLGAPDHSVRPTTIRTGLRTIAVDARRGLRINGQQVLLRGAAVHHDNGILGAATFAAAERRRARLLKEAGYNAIRSAHNPLSRAFLDACDELGLYVMDELTDVWFGRKTAHDESARFRDDWRMDAASMVAKDRNRPSVIMYSIGNEIAEVAWDATVVLAREIHSFLVESDGTRPTTIASNPLLAMMAGKEPDPAATVEEKTAPERKPATSTAANILTAKLGRLMVLASLLPAADKATRNVFDEVDIAGYNYAYASYGGARKRYPDRIILGTESMPGDLPAIWERVTSIPGVIGDFNWTGWDYLGEVGLGWWSYGNEIGGVSKPYPGVLAGSGVFDITGRPAGAMLALAQAVWGITNAPAIMVRPLDKAGLRSNKTPWLSSDAIPSWSWGAIRGRAEIEIYSAGDRVELFLNGRSLGRRAAGPKHGFVARFRTPYEPGELLAVAYRGGAELGRSSLHTVNTPDLRLRAETTALIGPDDLAYVWIEVADEDGNADVTATERIRAEILGPATIAALGSAAPQTVESFVDAEHDLHRGRALVILRGTGDDGTATLTIHSEQHGARSIEIECSAAPTPARKALA